MTGEPSFQARVLPWLVTCFGEEIAADKIERNHRFLEEALELVQAAGCTASEAHQLVDYVFGRPAGEPFQEVGGVMVTLASFCLAHGLDMHENGETELARVWTKVEQIRAKQAAKPKNSPLPEASPVVEWRRKTKGISKIHIGHFGGVALERAIVESPINGIHWNGMLFSTLADAKRAAEAHARNKDASP